MTVVDAVLSYPSVSDQGTTQDRCMIWSTIIADCEEVFRQISRLERHHSSILLAPLESLELCSEGADEESTDGLVSSVDLNTVRGINVSGLAQNKPATR